MVGWKDAAGIAVMGYALNLIGGAMVNHIYSINPNNAKDILLYGGLILFAFGLWLSKTEDGRPAIKSRLKRRLDCTPNFGQVVKTQAC